MNVTHIPNHLAMRDFPTSIEELKEYDCVILSDIGSNTLLLHPDTTMLSKATPNRLSVIKNYVENGGGLVMVGGYMSFQGIEGKARYAKTPIEEILPVTMYETDDRVEVPDGFVPIPSIQDHPIMWGIPSNWPFMLFYNQVIAKPSADVLLKNGEDPILAVWQIGQGRSIAFAPDAAPHGAPKEFLEWAYFPLLWQRIVLWATRQLS